ncbi:MAG: hypothetical protein RLZZ344_269 [Pseudomonadota bacterium]
MTDRLRAAVVGGGIMGATSCLVLAGHGYAVRWFAPEEPPKREDGAQARAYALTPDAVALLTSLGVWEGLAERSRRVTTMEIYPRGAETGVARLQAADLSIDCLAQIVGHADLLAACESAVQRVSSIRRDLRFPDRVRVGGEAFLAELSSSDTFDLIVAADGADSPMRRYAGILSGRRDYGQTALVMAFESTVPHDGVACQWFGEDRILALLPLAHDRQLSMVYSLPTEEARAWVRMSPQEIAHRVTGDSHARWGMLSALNRPVTSPLVMTLVERPALGRMLLVGDAAHTVHPLAGYGLNLGMQDLRALEAGLANCASHAIPRQLQKIARQRAGAVRRVQWGLDGLWRAMRLEMPGIQTARRLGIHCLSAFPTLRRWLIAQALGPTA